MAGKHRRGRSWYLSWVEPETGAKRQRALGPVGEAEAEAARIALERRHAAGAGAAGPALTDAAVRYSHWRAAEYPDSYARVEEILRLHLLPALGALPLMALRADVVEAYKHARLAARAAPGTVSKELRVLQALLNWCVRLDIIPRNPAAGVRAPRDLASRPAHWYTAAELAALYAAADSVRHPLSPPPGVEAAQWRLLANTGLRRAEALQLRRRDVGREALRVLSEPGARTKSGRWRHVPLTAGAEQALERLKAQPDTAGHILRPQHPRSLSRAFERCAARAGLPGHLHSLRHTYGAHLAQAGVDINTIRALMGHSTVRVTERHYAHLSPAHLRDAVRRLRL